MVCSISHSHFVTGELQSQLDIPAYSKAQWMEVNQEMRENYYGVCMGSTSLFTSVVEK